MNEWKEITLDNGKNLIIKYEDGVISFTDQIGVWKCEMHCSGVPEITKSIEVTTD